MTLMKVCRLFRSARVICLVLLCFLLGCGSAEQESRVSSSDLSKRAIAPIGIASAHYSTNEFNSSDVSLPGISADSAAQTSSCSSFVEGAPRGLSCLHCGHPRAREQALRLVEVLSQSCRRNLALTMLVDDSFSDDRDFLGELVRVSSARGSRLHLYLYLANGPWQRSYKSTPNKGIGSDMSPEEFRQRIKSDAALRNFVVERVNWAMPLVSYAQTQGAQVYIMPMLEDNLDRDSARALESLVLEAIPGNLYVALGRNPCPGCYAGNDDSVPEGLFLDQHIHSPSEPVRAPGGLITNDGADAAFPHEAAPRGVLSFEAVLGIARRAAETNNTFVLWRKVYQGLGEGGVKVDPDYRTYVMPTAEDEAAILSFLSE